MSDEFSEDEAKKGWDYFKNDDEAFLKFIDNLPDQAKRTGQDFIGNFGV
jgi:hypothetical protein